MDGATCNNCGCTLVAGKPYVVDERTDAVYCGRHCFNDWAADNAQNIIAYYAKLNVRTAN